MAREHRDPVGRDRLFSGPFLAEPVMVEAAVQRLEQLGRAPLDLVVDGQRAREEARAAARRLLPAGERDHRRPVGVEPQLEVAPVHARRCVLGGRIEHVADQLALRVLRQRRSEPGADAPNGSDELVDWEPVDR